jgi:hypothetical protein
MTGQSRHRVQLRLGLRSHNLLIEEYPLAEMYITQDGNEHWILDTEVANYAGIARFVIGLKEDIDIIDTPELEAYIADYVAKYLS